MLYIYIYFIQYNIYNNIIYIFLLLYYYIKYILYIILYMYVYIRSKEVKKKDFYTNVSQYVTK